MLRDDASGYLTPDQCYWPVSVDRVMSSRTSDGEWLKVVFLRGMGGTVETETWIMEEHFMDDKSYVHMAGFIAN